MSASGKKLTCVGAVAGAHGVHGNIKVKPFTDDPGAFAEYGPLLNERGDHLFTPKNARPVGKFYSLAVTEKLTREDVEALKSTKLYVPRAALPAPDEEEFYYSDLMGLRVEDMDGADIGIIQAVHEFGAGDVLEIRPPKGPSFYHPFTRESTPTIDLAGRRVSVRIEEADEARGDGAPRISASNEATKDQADRKD